MAAQAGKQGGRTAVYVVAQESEIRIISDTEQIDKRLSEIQNLKQT